MEAQTYEVARCARCKVQLIANAVMVNVQHPDSWGHPVGNGDQCWKDGQPAPLFEVEIITLHDPGALTEIAAEVPTDDQWKSAATFMEWVASTLDHYGVERPAHYEED